MDEANRARGDAAVAALLLAQVCIGYEWLLSGLTKLAHGDFPGGLARQLVEMGDRSPGWYRAFLAGAVEPHAHAFGYAIETAELLIGLVLLGTAAAMLLGRPRWERALRLAAGVAAAAGLALLVNFELANGAGFGLRLAAESFDEGLDLDTLMIGLHLAILVWSAGALRTQKRVHRLQPI